MKKLIQELKRLFLLPHQPCQRGTQNLDKGKELTEEELVEGLKGESSVVVNLLGPDDTVRTIVIGITDPKNWVRVAAVYQGIQEDLELPAPAVSVSPVEGFQLWFSLTKAVPANQAANFTNALRRKYLSDLPSPQIRQWPEALDSRCRLPLVPSYHETAQKWSAFIDPTMGGMFIDDAGLEISPGMDRQADMLSGIKSIKAEDFVRAMGLLESDAESKTTPEKSLTDREVNHSDGIGSDNAGIRSPLNVGSNFSNPKSFLLAVMNDPKVSGKLRIRAAKALLPYFETDCKKPST